MSYEHGESKMFKVLGEVIFCIPKKNVCIDYFFFQKNTTIWTFNKVFADTPYNYISGISIPELLITIVSCGQYITKYIEK